MAQQASMAMTMSEPSDTLVVCGEELGCVAPESAERGDSAPGFSAAESDDDTPLEDGTASDDAKKDDEGRAAGAEPSVLASAARSPLQIGHLPFRDSVLDNTMLQ